MRLHALFVGFMLAVALALAGCAGGGGTGSTGGGGDTTLTVTPSGNVVETSSDTVALQPAVKVIPSDGSITVASIDDDNVTLTGAVPAWSAGDVIVQNEGDVQFLRKVVAVTEKRGKDGEKVFTVQTARADMTDVFKEANVDRVEHVGPDLLGQFQPAVPGISFGEPVATKFRGTQPVKFSIPINFSKAVVGSSARGNITATGNVSLDLDVETAFELNVGGIKRFKLVPVVTVAGDLQLTGDASGEFKTGVPISLPLTVPVAGIGPVGINGTIQLYMQVDGRIEANASLAMDGSVKVRVGVQCTDNQWSAVHTITPSFHVTPPEARVDGALNVSLVQPKVDFSLLGMGGVYLKSDVVRVEVKFKGQTDPPGYSITTNGAFKATAGAYLKLGPLTFFEGELPAFRKTLDLGVAPVFIPTRPPEPEVTGLFVLPNGDGHVRFGQPAYVTAYALFDNGLFLPTVADWSSDDTSRLQVSNSGTIGILEPLAAGTITIRASHPSGHQATYDFVVDEPRITSIDVTPSDASVQVFSTTRIRVTGHYSDGSARDITGDVFYATTTADAGKTATYDDGTVEGLAQGDIRLFAVDLATNVRGSTFVHVRPPSIGGITINPKNVFAVAGEKVQYRAYGNVQDGSRRDITRSVTWMAAPSDVATVNESSGLVTTLRRGLSVVTAYDPTGGGGFSAQKLHVSTARLVKILISAGTGTVNVGDRLDCSAIAHYADGTTDNVTRDLTWISLNPLAGRMSEEGSLLALSPGKTYVVGLLGQSFAYLPVEITGATSLLFNTPGPSSVGVGESFGFDIGVVDAQQRPVALEKRITLELRDNGSGAKLLGQTSITTVNGVAQFRNLTIDRAATGLRIRARASGLGSARGPLLDVSSPSGGTGRLYVTGTQSDAIAWYDVDSTTGALTFNNSLGMDFGTGPTALASTKNDPLHPLLFASMQNSNEIYTYRVDPATGDLTKTDTVTANGTRPHDMVLYNDSALFVVNRDSNVVQVMAVDLQNAVLTHAGQYATGTAPTEVRFLDVAGTKDLLFVENFTSNNFNVFVWDENAGTLAEVTGSPFANQGGGDGPKGLAVGPYAPGKYAMYVTNSTTGTITAFTVNTDPAGPSFGNLTFAGTSTSMPQVRGATLADGFFYSLSPSDRAAYGYGVDAITGLLSDLTGFPVSTGTSGTPERAVFATTGAGTRMLFVTNYSATDPAVSSLRVNPDGSLTPVTSTTDAPGGANGLLYLQH